MSELFVNMWKPRSTSCHLIDKSDLKVLLLQACVSLQMFVLRITNRGNPPSKKIQTLTKSIDIWVVTTLNQLFIRSSYTQIKF